MSKYRAGAAVLSGIILNLAFGGLYAYSTLVPALEQSGTLRRSDTAMVFALSTSSFMFGVWLCGYLLRRWRAGTIAMVAGFGAMIGLLLCAWLPSLWVLVTGYSGLYGISAGIGYALSLASLANVSLKRPGASAGMVVSAFAVGSLCWAQAIGMGIAHIGISVTLYLSAFLVAGFACVAGLILRFTYSIDRLHIDVNKGSIQRLAAEESVSCASLSNLTIWLTFFAVASAGLTVIGHALQLLGTYSQSLVLGLSVVAIAGGANGFGRLLGGVLTDGISSKVLLSIPLIVTAVALGVLYIQRHLDASYIAIILIALMYGWCSAAIPAVVMKDNGQERFSKIYGRIFSAWGLAGLVAPWAAGWSFSLSSSYDSALIALVILNIFALGVLHLMTANSPSQR